MGELGMYFSFMWEVLGSEMRGFRSKMKKLGAIPLGEVRKQGDWGDWGDYLYSTGISSRKWLKRGVSSFFV